MSLPNSAALRIMRGPEPGAGHHALAWKAEPRSVLVHHLTPAFPYKRNATLPASAAFGGLPVIMHGLVARCRSLANGKRSIVGLLAAGDVCFERTFANQYDEQFLALTPCVVSYLPFASAYSLAQERPAFGRAVWRIMARAAGIQTEWQRSMSEPAERRLAHRVCEILQRMRVPGAVDGIELPRITQVSLAGMAGMSVVHANRCLAQLSTLGFTRVHFGTVIVLDCLQLMSFATFDPAYLWPHAPLPADELELALARGSPADFKAPFG